MESLRLIPLFLKDNSTMANLTGLEWKNKAQTQTFNWEFGMMMLSLLGLQTNKLKISKIKPLTIKLSSKTKAVKK